MVNRLKWFHDFLEYVPKKQVDYLLWLGLPVAGKRFEVDNGVVYFGKNFAVDRKNNLYYKGARVSPRVWTNLGVLENVKRGLRTNLIMHFGVEGVRYMNYDGLAVQRGKVVIEDVDAIMYGYFTDPFPGVYFNGKEYVFPRGTPASTELRIGRDVDVLFREGDIVYGVSHAVEYNEYFIVFGVKDITGAYYAANYLLKDEQYRKFHELVEGGDIRGLRDLSREYVFSKMKRKNGRIKIGEKKIICRPYEIIIGTNKDLRELEKFRGEIEGWSYYRIEEMELYRKKVGRTLLIYEPAFNELSVSAVNGWKLRTEVPPDMLPMSLRKLIDVLYLA